MINKAQQIRGYKQANPTHKPSDIAKACGVKTTYVYQVLHADKQNKRKVVKPVDPTPTAGQETLRKEIVRLNGQLDKWKNLAEFNDQRIISLQRQVRDAKLHHSGLEYVISYLESRLGITEKPNGASV
jgi:hypothetical protein